MRDANYERNDHFSDDKKQRLRIQERREIERGDPYAISNKVSSDLFSHTMTFPSATQHVSYLTNRSE